MLPYIHTTKEEDASGKQKRVRKEGVSKEEEEEEEEARSS